jgi:hypothetical protein
VSSTSSEGAAERAHLGRGLRTDDAAERELDDRRGEVPPAIVRGLAWLAVDDVDVVAERLEQTGDLLRRMLQVVVHRDHDLAGRGADAAKQRRVLAVVPHEVDAADPGPLAGELADHFPAPVAAAVVDEQELDPRAARASERFDAVDERRQARLALVDRDDDRERAERRGRAHEASPTA